MVSILIMLNMPLALKSLWRKNKENADEDVHINTMGSIDSNVDAKEETKEKISDKIKKTITGKKAKKKMPMKRKKFWT